MDHLILNADARRMPVDLSAIDAIATDPPYGIKYVHGVGGRAVRGRRSLRRNADMPIAGDEKPFDPRPWLGRPCLFWGANHCAALLPPGGSWLAWDKAAGGGPEDSFVDGEFAWCSIPGIKRNLIRYLWKGVCQAGEKGFRRFHPTQKPVAVMRRCLRLMGLPPGSLILDPYMGSGSTIVAALAEGHRAIGIEVDRRWCEVARRRIERPHARVARPARDEAFPLFSGVRD